MKQPVQFRSASAVELPARTRQPQVQASEAPAATVSFASDIGPLFKQFQGPMMWRLDLTSYDAVKANAPLIFGQISTQLMPPPPFPPLSDAQVATFAAWMKQGFPP
jgi:hypothetical protein